MNEILYTSTDLLAFMQEHGLPKSRMWLLHQERKGNLICPRMPNGRRDRRFTLEQMESIVASFGVKGEGRWQYA